MKNLDPIFITIPEGLEATVPDYLASRQEEVSEFAQAPGCLRLRPYQGSGAQHEGQRRLLWIHPADGDRRRNGMFGARIECGYLEPADRESDELFGAGAIAATRACRIWELS